MKKKALSILLSAAMMLSLAACGGDAPQESSQDSSPASESGSESGSQESSQESGGADSQEESGNDEKPAETVVLKFGTHWVRDLDPNFTDEVTGEYTMEESMRQAHQAAAQAIKDTYNVEFEFLQYPNDVKSDLMTSVLAGDPICDLALLWGGSEPDILSQNVLQDLSAYEDLFQDEESSWLLKDAMFGGRYLLNNEMGAMTYFPLIVNLTMLEKVDALKDADGNTIYPMDLFKEGKWTWSTFEDYLTKINAYYANVESADGCVYDFVQAYETDHRYAALAAIHANGGGIYSDGQVTADSQEAIDGVEFIKKLMDAKLLTECGTYDDGFTPEWCRGGEDFKKGGTVFTDCPNWQVGAAGSDCAARGESIAIVPWPRPDRLEADSPEYMQSTNGGNSVAILKGVSPERTELAIKSFILYWQTYYKTYGNVEKVSEYQAARAVEDLQNYGVDVFHETYGQDLIDTFIYIKEHMNTNFAHMMGLWDQNWEAILGKSLYGLEGMSSYDVAIKANLTDLTNKTDNIAAILQTDEVHDNQAPNVTTEDIILAAGTDAAGVDWTTYFTVEDSVDGSIAVTADMITVSEELDLATPGEYGDALVLKVSDSSGNEKESKAKVIVYNGDNTTAPTATAKEELPEIALNTETSGINWKDYLESAVDADGLDVSGNVTADLSQLDTTTPGSYEVVLTVTDYAGNEGTVTLSVTVAAAE
ncbi:MAG: hypothetical protein HFH94_09060 [Lachnospiraceae bacterium]|jgi:hypothetical protein|nr:immunoglobulin-like domain-containing protein [uncultured Acetatifactor sp.]MCI9219871.1 hypothetical protein [Lachnospiraceae bacterium]